MEGTQYPIGRKDAVYYVLESSSGLNTTANGSVDEVELLVSYLGARHRSQTETGVLTMFYSLIFVTGVVGNVSTCIVIIKNGYMHTATNFYLFSLAVSDLLTLVMGLPPELYGIWEAYPWRLGEPFCQFKSFITEMTSTASVLIITAFTVERYIAICHPMRSHTMSRLSRAVKIIMSIWVLAGLMVLPVPLHTRTFFAITDPYDIPDSLVCSVPRKWLAHRMNYYFAYSTIILFLLPMTVITVLYIFIGMALKRSGLAKEFQDSSHAQHKKSVLKLLVAVVIAFFICWAPFHAQRLMTVFIGPEEWTHLLLEIQSQLFYVSGILWFVGSTVNPILYNLMSRKYRQAFKHTLCRCCFKSRQLGTGSRYYLKRFTSQPSDTFVTSSGSTRYAVEKRYLSSTSDGEMVLRALTELRNRNNLKDNRKDKNEANVANGNACNEISESPSFSPEVTVIAERIRDELELETLITQRDTNANQLSNVD